MNETSANQNIDYDKPSGIRQLEHPQITALGTQALKGKFCISKATIRFTTYSDGAKISQIYKKQAV